MQAAAGGARELARQVVTFSRGLPKVHEPVDASGVFDEAIQLLGNSLPANVELCARLSPDVGAILLPPADAHRILVSLAKNAVDAMPDGGTLTLRLDVQPGRGPDLEEGVEYVCLLVQDTGIGMDEATRRRAVEPFFTTRPRTHGTGLGLAIVHGIVTAAGGALLLESTPGVGTTARVYLPRTG
jgi:two-component system, cell cycle sensor histidine kinase and response regulator CckA